MDRFNRNQQNEREQLIFHRDYDEKYYLGGCERFEDLDVNTALYLIQRGFLDPEDDQNGSPTAQEMVDFCMDHDGEWTLHGYVISPKQDDCRVTIEGVQSSGPLSADAAVDFLKTFRYADELEASVGCGAYCWYD